MKDKATPRPWRHEGSDPLIPDFIFGPNSEMVAEMRGWGANLPIGANAELVVRAVNSHDALVEALEVTQKNFYGPNWDHDLNCATTYRDEVPCDCGVEKVKAALALARGETK